MSCAESRDLTTSSKFDARKQARARAIERRLQADTRHMNRARHAGIVAVGAEGASLCHRAIRAENAADLGARDHPRVTTHPDSLGECKRHIEAFGARGCDAIVPGCTEMPRPVSEAESPLSAVDSTCALARAALRVATRYVSA